MIFPDAGLHRQNHRALDDARMTAKIWLKLAGK
jgi:DNA polymerase III epsilon subunit-like protein